ncbi:MAG: O-antigen ligase family protein [Endomicrobiales bacterium]
MKTNRLGIFLLCIIAALPFNIERNLGGVWVTSSDVLVACALTLWLVKIIREKSFKRTAFPLFYLIGGLLLAFLVSVFGAVSPFAALKETAKYFLLFGFFYLLVNETSEERIITKIPLIIFLSSCLVSAWFIHDFFAKQMPFYYHKTWERYPFSLLHFNLLGSYIALALPMGFYELFSSDKAVARIALIFGIAVQITALILTYSRINWIVATLITLVILTAKYRIRGIVYAVLITVVPFVVILAVNPHLKIQERLSSTVKVNDGSLIEREELAGTAFELIRMKPVFGVGLGNFKEASMKYYGKNVNEMVHNIYLQFWTEAGILAMLLFIALIIRYYFDVRRLMPGLPAQTFQPLLKYGVLSFTAVILGNQFNDPFIRVLKEYFVILLSFPYVIDRILKQKRKIGS